MCVLHLGNPALLNRLNKQNDAELQVNGVKTIKDLKKHRTQPLL